LSALEAEADKVMVTGPNPNILSKNPMADLGGISDILLELVILILLLNPPVIEDVKETLYAGVSPIFIIHSLTTVNPPQTPMDNSVSDAAADGVEIAGNSMRIIIIIIPIRGFLSIRYLTYVQYFIRLF